MTYEYKDDFLSKKDTGFYLKEGFLWLTGGFFFILSTLSLSLIMHLGVYNDWEAAPYFSTSLFSFFIYTFPFLLLIPLVVGFLLFLFITRFSYYTKDILLYFFITLSFFFVILTSLLGFYLKIGACLDTKAQNTKIYELINKNRYLLWQSPDHGLLAGQIATIDDANNFLLVDFEGHSWFVKKTNPDTSLNPLIKTGVYVKIMGRQAGANSFEAKKIKSFN